MRTPRKLLVLVGMLALVSGGTAQGVSIDVPNGSFEQPALPDAPPYASPDMSNWQKPAVPAWWLNQNYTAEQWNQSAGTFRDNSSAPLANLDGKQAAFMFAIPGMELYQDLAARFEAGKAYRLTVGIEGGGYGMLLDVPLEIRLYYRDPTSALPDNRVTVGATVVRNTNTTGTLSLLTDYVLDVPSVAPGDAWAGQNIGVQLISTVDFASMRGYWDIDNVRLVSVPEPTTAILLIAGLLGLRRRRA